MIGLRNRVFDLHLDEVPPELLLDGQALHICGAGALDVLDGVYGRMLGEGLELDFDDDCGGAHVLELQCEPEVEDSGGRDVVETALEPQHAEAGQRLLESQQQVQGLLDTGPDDEGHAEGVAVEHLVEGCGWVGLLKGAALDFGEDALLALGEGLVAEEHGRVGLVVFHKSRELLHAGLDQRLEGLQLGVEGFDERAGMQRLGLFLFRSLRILLSVGNDIVEQRQVFGVLFIRHSFRGLEVEACSLKAKETSRVKRLVEIFDLFFDADVLLFGGLLHGLLEAFRTVEGFTEAVPALQEEELAVSGARGVVPEIAEAR